MADFTPPFQQHREMYTRSHAAVTDTRRRLETVKARASKVRAELRNVQSEHRTILERNREELIAFHKTAISTLAARTDRFWAVVSHELRQPLNAAIVAAQLLELERQPRAMEVLRRQLLQMKQLLDSLTDMSRISMKNVDLDLRPVNLRQILERAVETLDSARRDKDLTLVVRDWPSELFVSGDELRLRQVFGNLLSNAIRYTPRGGRIEVLARTDAQAISVDIRDTGKGVAAHELLKIFEPFSRGADSGGEGLGIGLALVRGLVELHGGSVGVTSDGPGRGSCFTITLPRLEGDGSSRPGQARED